MHVLTRLCNILELRCFDLLGLQQEQPPSALHERRVCLTERCQRLVALGGAPATPRAMSWRTCWRMQWTTCASRTLAGRSWRAVQRRPRPRCWYELVPAGYDRYVMLQPVQAPLHGGWATATGTRASKQCMDGPLHQATWCPSCCYALLCMWAAVAVCVAQHIPWICFMHL